LVSSGGFSKWVLRLAIGVCADNRRVGKMPNGSAERRQSAQSNLLPAKIDLDGRTAEF
jgi:hypothetical protein